jgi:thiosulfate dehydrogenase [quinone] large subunit
MAYIVVFAELALGLGLILGFLTPIAAIASIVLNLLYFVLMINDWAEQGQNLMMILAAVVVLGTHGWDVWSVDHLLHLFGA